MITAVTINKRDPKSACTSPTRYVESKTDGTEENGAQPLTLLLVCRNPFQTYQAQRIPSVEPHRYSSLTLQANMAGHYLVFTTISWQMKSFIDAGGRFSILSLGVRTPNPSAFMSSEAVDLAARYMQELTTGKSFPKVPYVLTLLWEISITSPPLPEACLAVNRVQPSHSKSCDSAKLKLSPSIITRRFGSQHSADPFLHNHNDFLRRSQNLIMYRFIKLRIHTLNPPSSVVLIVQKSLLAAKSVIQAYGIQKVTRSLQSTPKNFAPERIVSHHRTQ